MQTLLVDLILAAVVAAVFLIALRGRKIGWGSGSQLVIALTCFLILFMALALILHFLPQ